MAEVLRVVPEVDIGVIDFSNLYVYLVECSPKNPKGKAVYPGALIGVATLDGLSDFRRDYLGKFFGVRVLVAFDIFVAYLFRGWEEDSF